MGGKNQSLEAGSLKLRSNELEKMQDREQDWKEPPPIWAPNSRT